jgi:hypothetical protein
MWTLLVSLVTTAIFFAFVAELLRQGSWDWLTDPVISLPFFCMRMVPGLVDAKLGPVGEVISVAAVLLLGAWGWLVAPLLLTIGFVEAIRLWFQKIPKEGLAFPQAVSAYVVAITISEMWMAVAMAPFGSGGLEGGFEFARASLPVAIAPLALMVFRRAIAAAWPRRRRFPS